jgi:hypothetical protein
MHAWDEPAETLLSLASKRGVPLVLPRLGESIEPSVAPPARAWWRGPVVHHEPVPQAAERSEDAAPRLRDLPWPLD